MDKYLELYNKSINPLDDDKILAEIVQAYILKGKFGFWSFYYEIEEIGTEGKKADHPKKKEKDLLWSVLFNIWKDNILNHNDKINPQKYNGHFNELVQTLKGIPDISTYAELCSIVEKYPVISKYGIMPSGDRLWNFVLSKNITGIKEIDVNPVYRLYINSEAKDTYKLIIGFLYKCFKNNIPFYLKFIEYPEDYPERADSIVIWADENTLFQYIKILNELKAKFPEIVARCGKPPVLTMKVDNWIGFGEEPKEGSYTTARIDLLMNSINDAICQWIVENQDRKVTSGKVNFSVKQYIAAKSVKESFKIVRRETQRNPRQIKNYGVAPNDLSIDLYTEICCEILDEIIPAIQSEDKEVIYKKNGKNLYFRLKDSIYELLAMTMNSDTEKANLFKKIRNNIKIYSKKYGIDSQKFIYNDDYLERFKHEEEQERE